MNDEERRLWVLNDEGLYNEWKRSRRPLRSFIRENRAMLTNCIGRALGQEPAEPTWRDYGNQGASFLTDEEQG